MTVLQGTIHNGQIVLDGPSVLPEGTRVQVLPLPTSYATCGMREEEWPVTSEGIAALLARMDQVEPGWLSPEDDAAWQKSLQDQREQEKSQFVAESEKLRGVWE